MVAAGSAAVPPSRFRSDRVPSIAWSSTRTVPAQRATTGNAAIAVHSLVAVLASGGAIVSGRPPRWHRGGRALRSLVVFLRAAERGRKNIAVDDEIKAFVNSEDEDTRKTVDQTRRSAFRTVCRVAFSSIVSFAGGLVLFPFLRRLAWKVFVGGAGPSPLSSTAEGYVCSFLAFISVLFSILAGNSYTALYSQNEAIFYALFREVSEAKALMEQAALVCSGRPFYRSVLTNIKRYVDQDLRRLDLPPAVLLSMKPHEDPLESILYLTSVGVPSVIYETVKSLRQRRGDRLGAVQRKLPTVQIVLLYVLGAMHLSSFLLISCSVTDAEIRFCRMLFALLTGALVMTMGVIHELWTPVGGAYNVDGVLAVMVNGVEIELEQRLQGKCFGDTRLPSPPPLWKTPGASDGVQGSAVADADQSALDEGRTTTAGS